MLHRSEAQNCSMFLGVQNGLQRTWRSSQLLDLESLPSILSRMPRTRTPADFLRVTAPPPIDIRPRRDGFFRLNCGSGTFYIVNMTLSKLRKKTPLCTNTFSIRTLSFALLQGGRNCAAPNLSADRVTSSFDPIHFLSSWPVFQYKSNFHVTIIKPNLNFSRDYFYISDVLQWQAVCQLSHWEVC